VSGAHPGLNIRLLFLGDPRYDRRLKSFTDFLRSSGHNIEVICGITTNEELDGIGADVIKLNSAAGPRKFLEYHRKLSSKLLKAPAVDLVIACDLYSLGAAAIAKRKGLAKRAIYDSREVYLELPSLIGRPFVKSIWKRFEHRHLAAMDAILVTGTYDFQAIFAAHDFIPRGLLIRNLPVLKPFTVDSNFRKRHSIPQDALLFVYLGGLQKGRGLQAFIQALPRIDAISGFVIIGDGPERAKLGHLANDLIKEGRVIFTGQVESGEALSILGACDIGVSLIEPLSMSYEYALPSKLFEYMAARLVTISSPLVHVRELFGDKEPWLFFADPSNLDEVVCVGRDAIVASRNSEVRDRARKLFEDGLNASIELPKLESLIEEIFSATK